MLIFVLRILWETEECSQETNSQETTGRRDVNCRIPNTHICRKQGPEPEVSGIGAGGCNDKVWLLIGREGTGVFRLHTTSLGYLSIGVIRENLCPKNLLSRNEQKEEQI